MGSLNFFDLKRYGADVLVETGTGKGFGVDYALQCGLPKVHSCEIYDEVYDYVKQKYANDPRVEIHQQSSIYFLDTLLPLIAKDIRIVFWLDAHFPGADFVTHEYKSDDNEINLPLVHEVEIIKKHRAGCSDVILIDDMRILDPYDRKTLESLGIFLNYPGLGFLDDFKTTHHISKYFVHQGYIELVPITL